MSTSKHIDKICIAVIAVMLILTILFLCGGALGLTAVARTVKYEKTLFDNSYVHQIDIVMNDWDAFLETCENEEYAACTVVVDGEKHANIAIRAKGNTSLSSVKSSGSRRYSFKLEFDQYETGKTLDGLDKLCLNNLIQDNTMMKDYLVYQMMGSFGVDSPLCSFAYLTVNGEDWGLYLAVEGVEDSFLSRNYGSDPGELYKPDSLSFGGGRGNGKDFNFDDLELDTDAGDEQQTEQAQNGFDVPDEFPDMSGGFPADGQFPDMSGSFPGGGQFPGQSGEGGPPDGFPSDGQFPGGSGQFPGGSGGFPGGQFQGRSEEDGQTSEEEPQSSGKGDFPGGFGGFGGMGSDDVKLKYIDDDPDSYSNIFDSAKTDVTKADKKRLISSLQQLGSYENLEEVLDTDEVLRYFVVHNFVCNGDSYTGSMIHNYYLHEKDGQLGMIPWDYNLAFGTFQGGDASSSVNADIDNPVSGSLDDRPMVGWIFSDERYTEQYHALFSEFLSEWIDSGRLAQLISDTAEMIRPYVEKDPTKFCTTEEFETGVATLSSFISLRGEAVSRQLAGDDTAVAVDGLNLSDMGSMGGGKGGSFGGDRPEGFSGSFDGTLPEGFEGSLPDGFDGSMPDGFGGSMPDGFDESMPGGFNGAPLDGFDGSMPEGFSPPDNADGMGDPPTMPGQTGGASSESGSNTSPTESGAASERPSSDRPQGQDDFSGRDGESSKRPSRGDGSGFSPGSMNGSPGTGTVLILLGVSVLALAVGLLVAIKKKY